MPYRHTAPSAPPAPTARQLQNKGDPFPVACLGGQAVVVTSVYHIPGRGEGEFPALLEQVGGVGSPGRGVLRVFSYAVGTAGNLGLPSRSPISWEEMGERTPGGGGSSPGNPLLWWDCGGEAVPLTGYLACGPHIERPVTARPPAGRAGDVDRYPLGKGGENHSFSYFFLPSTNHLSRPPEPVGGP